MERFPRSMRTSVRHDTHPDDVLKHLARRKGPVIGPTLFAGYQRPRDGHSAIVGAGLAVAATLAVVVFGPLLLPRNRLHVTGIRPNEPVGATTLSRLKIEITTKPGSAARHAKLRIDGVALDTTIEGDALVWRPNQRQALTEGKHRLTVTSGGRMLWRGPVRTSIAFVVDRTPPAIRVAKLTGAYPTDQPITIRGTVEPGARVTVGGVRATVDGTRFSTTFATPPIGMLAVVARDAAGNRSGAVKVRTNVALPVLRAVHVSALAWITPTLRDPVFQLAAEGRINAIQLDLKDERGEIGYVTEVKLANQIHASKERYRLREAVDEIHRRGLRVVGRIVVFRDPLMAAAEWELGGAGRDAVVQGTDGQPYKSSYGKIAFTNPANRNVRDYNLAIAKEAAMAGVDDIMFDYIRRPEGDINQLRFPGAAGSVENEIIAFLRETGMALRGTKTRIGVSVFGIAARTPEQIAQPVKRMAEVVDYVAPMVYPSHWSKGFYDVADPNGQPYDIVQKSLLDFTEKVKGTGAEIVPWLQDFSYGRSYGAKEVRAQIDAARDDGIKGYMMWSPKVIYHGAGLPISRKVATK